MMRSFRAVVCLAVVSPAVAVTQLPASPYALSGPCAGGQCPAPRPLIQAAASPVQQVIGTGLHLIGNAVNPASPWQPVAGASARPRWYPGRRIVQMFR